MNISEHFTLEELCFSEVASRFGLDNTPDPTVMKHLHLLAGVMERVRTLLANKAMFVHSAYRSVQVNKAIGGVETSAHCLGLACDFVCPMFGTPLEVAVAIHNSDIEYDQLILEYGWVHIGLARDGMLSRREALTKRSRSAAYESGIQA
jgi:zinc D-Ala-D-Ala carboxypeptidase